MTAPNLGNLFPNEQRCLRARSFGLCLKPGAVHIIWSGADASIACDECFEFAKVNRIFEASHPMGPDCGLVASMYFPDEESCRMPETEADIRSGRIVF